SPEPTSATGPAMAASLDRTGPQEAGLPGDRPLPHHAGAGPCAGAPLQELTVTVRQRWTMVAAILGSGIVFLDGTVVNVALKKIGQDLPASIVGVLEGQTYVTSGYLATLAALLILAGALADFYGRRRIFTIGLAGFGITSVLCGIAPNLELLVV